MLVVTCACGAKFKARPEFAGRKAKCPRCGVMMVISAAQASASSVPTTAAKPVASASPPVPRVASRTQSDSPAPVELLAQLATGEAVIEAPPPQPVIPVESPAEGGPLQMEYARDARIPKEYMRSKKDARYDAIGEAKRTFWRDLVFAYAYPFATSGNAVNTIIVLGLSCVRIVPFCIISGIVTVWLASVYMNVVTQTAAGSDDFHGANMEGGIWEGFFRPAVMFFVTYLLANLPMAACLILMHFKIIPSGATTFLLWAGFGLFLWPMIMLLTSLDSLALIIRFDKVITTIASTLLPYLCVWVCLLIPAAIMFGTSLGVELSEMGIISGTRSSAKLVSGLLTMEIIENCVTVFLTLVAMRVIGLYYLHFKRRFTFKLE